jgi:hypothetical protein
MTGSVQPDRGPAIQRVRDARRQLNRAENEYVLALCGARRDGASFAAIARAAGRSASTIRKRLG